jgi:glycosyltransferase involved in cell wall biosynthesis
VAWVASLDTFTQVGRILQPLAIGLMDELINATIFIPERSDERELPNLPIDVVRYGRPSWLAPWPGSMHLLANEAINRQVELLHALDAGAAKLVGRVSEATGLNYIVSSYAIDDWRQLGELDERAVAVLPASEPIQRGLLEHHVAGADKIRLVRPGVYMVGHATCFTNSTQSIAIVAGGQMDDFAAYDAVLRTFNEVRNRGYDCVFFIIANGKAESRVRAAAEQMKLTSKLTFVDRQVALQLQGILKSADFYISPVASPQVDMASLLAMAAGDPVLAAGGQAEDFFIDGRTALMFKSGNAAELTAKLIGLLDDRAAAAGLAESALTYLRERHGAAAMVAQIAGIYRQAAAMPKLEPAETR